MIHSDNDEFPKLELTTFGTRQVFEKLKKVVLGLRSATHVDASCMQSSCFAVTGLDTSKNSYRCPS